MVTFSANCNAESRKNADLELARLMFEKGVSASGGGITAASRGRQ